MRIGIFGGSFDPFHRGHEALLRAASEKLNYDQIFVMPIALPPLKSRLPLPAGFRLKLIELGLKDLPGVTISEFELDRPEQISYTYNTCLELKKLYPQAKFSLIGGSDILASLDKWYKFSELVKIMDFELSQRAAYPETRSLELAAKLGREYGAKISFFPMNKLPKSSSEIRKEIGQGLEPSGMVAEALRLINDYKLYSFDEAWQKISRDTYIKIVKLDNYLRYKLSEKRYLHSLSVMLYGVELAGRFNMDPNQVAVACILHDLAKEWPEDLQLRMAKKYQPGRTVDALNMHGFAAAAFARENLDVLEAEVLSAIAEHTLGGSSPLQRLVFLADTLEPNRSYEELKELQSYAMTDLKYAYLKTLQKKADYFEKIAYPESAAKARQIYKYALKNSSEMIE